MPLPANLTPKRPPLSATSPFLSSSVLPPLLLSSPLYWVVCRGEWRGGARTQGMYRVGEEQVVTVERLAGGLGDGCWRNSWWGEVTCIHTQSFKSSLNQQQVLKKPSGDRFSQECICSIGDGDNVNNNAEKCLLYENLKKWQPGNIWKALSLCFASRSFCCKEMSVYCLGTDKRRKKTKDQQQLEIQSVWLYWLHY